MFLSSMAGLYSDGHDGVAALAISSCSSFDPSVLLRSLLPIGSWMSSCSSSKDELAVVRKQPHVALAARPHYVTMSRNIEHFFCFSFSLPNNMVFQTSAHLHPYGVSLNFITCKEIFANTKKFQCSFVACNMIGDVSPMHDSTDLLCYLH